MSVISMLNESLANFTKDEISELSRLFPSSWETSLFATHDIWQATYDDGDSKVSIEVTKYYFEDALDTEPTYSVEFVLQRAHGVKFTKECRWMELNKKARIGTKYEWNTAIDTIKHLLSKRGEKSMNTYIKNVYGKSTKLRPSAPEYTYISYTD